MHRLHVRADYSPNAERPFAGDCGGFVGWRHRRWEWCAFNLCTRELQKLQKLSHIDRQNAPRFRLVLVVESHTVLVCATEHGFCRAGRMGEEDRRAAKALGYSAARWESGVDAPAADKQ